MPVRILDSGPLRSYAPQRPWRMRQLAWFATALALGAIACAEKGFPGFEAGSWFVFFAPKGTPESVISVLNKQVNEIIAIPAIEQQMIAAGADPVGGTPAQFSQFVQREYEKWKVIVVESGARAE